MSSSMKEVDYKCATEDCGHTQTIRYFPHEAVNPVVNCVKCRAGFGLDQVKQWQEREGMVPIGRARMVA